MRTTGSVPYVSQMDPEFYVIMINHYYLLYVSQMDPESHVIIIIHEYVSQRDPEAYVIIINRAST